MRQYLWGCWGGLGLVLLCGHKTRKVRNAPEAAARRSKESPGVGDTHWDVRSHFQGDSGFVLIILETPHCRNRAGLFLLPDPCGRPSQSPRRSSSSEAASSEHSSHSSCLASVPPESRPSPSGGPQHPESGLVVPGHPSSPQASSPSVCPQSLRPSLPRVPQTF